MKIVTLTITDHVANAFRHGASLFGQTVEETISQYLERDVAGEDPHTFWIEDDNLLSFVERMRFDSGGKAIKLASSCNEFFSEARENGYENSLQARPVKAELKEKGFGVCLERLVPY
jgi:hypothetical protein